MSKVKQHPRPQSHLLNPARKWVPSDQTDIRKTFARAKKELRKVNN